MSCPGVRDRLAEFALGLLSAEEASSVERHLEWCAGCRKEAEEMHGGLATVGFDVRPADLPPSLEGKVVERVTTAAGRRRPVRRRGMRVLVATTLAAVLAALGSLGWAVAERNRAEDFRETLERQSDRLEQIRELVESAGGRRAQLLPTSGNAGEGIAVVILGAEGQNQAAFVEAVMPSYDRGPYTVRLLDRTGRTRLSGQLSPGNGGLVLFQETGRDLATVTSVAVLDANGLKVLGGPVVGSVSD